MKSTTPETKKTRSREREKTDPITAPGGAAEVGWLALVSDKVTTLDYGVVQIVVHGGRVVQVERTERHRFEPRPNGNG